MGTVKYTGPVASFHCPTNAEIRSLKVHFSPKQEGSGDPSPENVRSIVGWDGVKTLKNNKNLLDTSKLSCSHPSNTWNASTETNDMIFENGELSGIVQEKWRDTTVFSQNTPFQPGTYTLSFDYINGIKNYAWKPVIISSTYSGWYSSYKGSIIADNDSGHKEVTFTADKPFYVALNLNSFDYAATTARNKIYNIQLELGSTATPYEPCKISITDYEFGVLGKNKCPAATGTEIGQNWEYDQYNHYINLSGLQPNHQYTLQCTITKVLTENSQNRFYLVSRNGSSFINLAQSEVPVTASITRYSNDDGTIRIQLNNNFSLDAERAPYLTNIQLELGSTATAYEPYNPKHTVYGGWVDLISGEVCEEWNTIYVKDLPSEWSYKSSNTRFQITLPSQYLNGSTGIWNNENIMSETYKTSTSNGYGNKQIAQYSNRYIYIRDDDFEGDVDAFLFAVGDTKIVYKLPTTTTYSLSPIAMQTFLGQNNVWSNADYVEVEYDLHETQDILNRKAFIIANQPHIVKPAAASLQNFKTDLVAPLKECKVHFSPVQDLHGYSNPWPAGGGKNIAKPYDNSYVSSSYISFDYSAANGTFRCYGTASASSTHSSPSATNAANNGATFTLPAGTYTLSIIDGDGANIYAQCVSSDETVLAETISYTTFTTNESLTVFVRLKVAAAATVDKTVKIQLEKGSSATSYAPYENICPISGWTGIEVYRKGKNLFNANDTVYAVGQGSTVYANGDKGVNVSKTETGVTVAATSTSAAGMVRLGEVKSGQSYFIQLERSSTTMQIWLELYDLNEFLVTTAQAGHKLESYANGSRKNQFMVTPSQDGWLWCGFGTGTSYSLSNIQFELGSVATTYEPYTGTTLPINWTTEAGTVYGGYVDLIKGEVWENCLFIVFDGSNDEPWYANGTDGYYYNKNITNGASPGVLMCSHYNAVSNRTTRTMSEGDCAMNALGQMFQIFDTSVSTNVEFKSKLNTDPVSVLLELATPQLVATLTPTQLKTLRGTNNIWSNANGDINLSYWSH